MRYAGEVTAEVMVYIVLLGKSGVWFSKEGVMSVVILWPDRLVFGVEVVGFPNFLGGWDLCRTDLFLDRTWSTAGSRWSYDFNKDEVSYIEWEAENYTEPWLTCMFRCAEAGRRKPSNGQTKDVGKGWISWHIHSIGKRITQNYHCPTNLVSEIGKYNISPTLTFRFRDPRFQNFSPLELHKHLMSRK